MGKTKPDDAGELKFEAALAELEQIVARMEGGQMPLEDMMKQFERGMKLSKFCSAKLGETEKRIEILMKTASGQEQWQEMPLRDQGLPGLDD